MLVFTLNFLTKVVDMPHLISTKGIFQDMLKLQDRYFKQCSEGKKNHDILL